MKLLRSGSVGIMIAVMFFYAPLCSAAGDEGWEFTVAPFSFLGLFNPIGKGSIIVPGYQHKFSVDEDDGRSEVHQGLIDPQILLDYENDKEFMFLELQAGIMTDKYFGTKGHSAYIMPSIGVAEDRPYDVSIEVRYKIAW